MGCCQGKTTEAVPPWQGQFGVKLLFFTKSVTHHWQLNTDSVTVRMNYMEEDQKMVLKFVEDFCEYISEREKEKE